MLWCTTGEAPEPAIEPYFSSPCILLRWDVIDNACCRSCRSVHSRYFPVGLPAVDMAAKAQSAMNLTISG